VLYFQGGGYSWFLPRTLSSLAAAVALAANAHVHVVDYRFAPGTPFPVHSTIDFRAYPWLVTDGDGGPENAGRTLGMIRVRRVASRKVRRHLRRGLAILAWHFPCAIATISPLAHLTLIGASIRANEISDLLGDSSHAGVPRSVDYLPVRDSPRLPRQTPGARRSSPTYAASLRCSSRSARTRSSTTNAELPAPDAASCHRLRCRGGPFGRGVRIHLWPCSSLPAP